MEIGTSLTYIDFMGLLVNENDCPLTGVYYDEQLRESFDKNNLNKESLQEALDGYINSIHSEYESMTSPKYILELCESNGYEFDADTLKMV